MYYFNSAVATKQIIDLLSVIATAYPSYPSGNAVFPLIIVDEPVQKPHQLKCTVDLQFTIGAWADDIFESSTLLDRVVAALEQLNIRLASTTPNFKDLVTGRWRKSGVFEVRYNMQTNSYEINR